MSEPYRIGFICTGNICRSPLAEALARHRLEQANVSDHVLLESFGTHDYHVGDRADPRTIATAHDFGIDVSVHRARRIKAVDCENLDLLLAMDSDHEHHLHRLASASARDRIQLYLPFVGIDEMRDVPDPYYGDAAGFIAVHQLLDRAAQRLVARLPELIAGRNG